MSRPKIVAPKDSAVAPKFPQSALAEMAVLGALLVHPDLFSALRQEIEPADFDDFNRRTIFLKMLELGESGFPAVCCALADSNPELKDYASAIAGNEACTPKQVPLYLSVMKAKSVDRRRVEKAELVAARARAGEPEATAAAIAELSAIQDYRPHGEEIQFMATEKLLGKKIAPREYLLDPVFTTRAMAEIFSWRGVGKTWFALSIARAISSGGSFLGWKAPKARRVLFVDGELDEFSLQQRIRLLDAGNDFFELLCCDAQENPFPHLAEPRAQKIIEDRIVATGAEVLILDNLSALAPSTNETEAGEWNILQGFFKNLKRQYGTTIIFLHHAGHSGTSRGTTRREDLLDVVIELKKPADYVATEGLRLELSFAKTRGKLSRHAEPLQCSLGEFNGQLLWDFKVLSDVRDARITELRNNGATVREISDETGIPRSTVSRILSAKKPRK